MVRLWAVLAASIVLAGCATGRVSFDNVTPAAPVRVQAEEFRPEGPGAFPAVVLMHGCHGVSPAVRGWGRWLRARGYVALVVDSWGSRGLGEQCTPGEDLPNTARFDDAIGALEWLQARPYVDRERIGIIGWSNGGAFSLAVVNGPTAERARRRGATVAFDAAANADAHRRVGEFFARHLGGRA